MIIIPILSDLKLMLVRRDLVKTAEGVDGTVKHSNVSAESTFMENVVENVSIISNVK